MTSLFVDKGGRGVRHVSSVAAGQPGAYITSIYNPGVTYNSRAASDSLFVLLHTHGNLIM